MDKKSFIDKIAAVMNNKNCDIFIGSGISSGSGLKSWEEFLKPLSKEIDIELSDYDDLPLIAQYIVNHNSGNRNTINRRLIDVFNKDYPLNNNHHVLSMMNVETIWTTNYDCLVEKSLEGKQVQVISSDAELGKPKTKNEIEVIKIHGSIKGNLKDIVLTQEDYDKFSFNKPGLAHRLRNTLTEKSILFIGYGYRDPNIRNIMVEASKLINDKTLVHFIILKKPKIHEDETKLDFLQRETRFNLWVKELNRLGITDLQVDKYDEIPSVLEQINIASRGNNVFITGSHKDTEVNYFKSLGEELTNLNQLCLINGQSEGVGAYILNGFLNKLISDKIEIGEKILFYPNPYADNEKYSDDITLIPSLKKERARMLSQVKVFIPFSGGIGTRAEIEIAMENRCIVIPGIMNAESYTNGVISNLLEDNKIMNYLSDNIPEYYDILKNQRVPTRKDLIEAIEKVI